MPIPKNPDPGKKGTDQRRTDKQAEKVDKSVKRDDVPRHPGEDDYEKGKW